MNLPVQAISALSFEVVPNIPLVKPGDDLSAILLSALAAAGLALNDGDIVCLAQKIVSKAEGRQVAMASVTPSAAAIALAKDTEKEPALCQLILDESETVMRKKPGVIIVRHRLGHVGANAGIDQSNIEHEGEQGSALLLPVAPDDSAREIRDTLKAATGARIGVLITDSMNRPWRLGTIGGAIGCAAMEVLDDLRGGADMYGRELKVAMVNRADSLAATATLLMGETTEGTPVVIIRGLAPSESREVAGDMMRPLEDDLFQ